MPYVAYLVCRNSFTELPRVIAAIYCTLISAALAADEMDEVDKKCFHILNEMAYYCINSNCLAPCTLIPGNWALRELLSYSYFIVFLHFPFTTCKVPLNAALVNIFVTMDKTLQFLLSSLMIWSVFKYLQLPCFGSLILLSFIFGRSKKNKKDRESN